ncbi:hypothetical protein AMTRI_Chr10g224900 [Amborella trichopoda]
MGKPHALVISYPAQGHIIPMMEFSRRMVEHGFAVTFVNTDYFHKRILEAANGHPQDQPGNGTGPIRLVSIPDGLEPGADRNQLIQLWESMLSSMPHALEKLIDDITNVQGLELHCVVADVNMGWALDVAKRLGIARTAFWAAAAGCLTVQLKLPELVRNGVLDENGLLHNRSMIQLTPNTPLIDPSHFPWLCVGDTMVQKFIYRYIRQFMKNLEGVEWVLCNSFYELEAATFDSFPNLLPIGPLLQSNHHGQPTSLWTEDETCLEWLNKQPECSVIYVSFGSLTLFDKRQLHELALALENLGRPFLWVARPDLIDKAGVAYLEGFLDRMEVHGKVVGWCPQREVLTHPSIACFVTHCGWNSTIEGVSNGVPLICWPKFVDQFLNKSYIVDIWKVGLELEGNKDGFFSKEEIRGKVEELLGDQAIRERALKLKEQAIYSVTEGTSRKNLTSFIEAMKMHV